MTSWSDVGFAYIEYIRTRINNATSEAERTKLASLLDSAYEEMVSNFLAEGVFNG